MADRLAQLSAEQVALMPLVRDEWLAIGLSTAPADRARAEAAIRRMYETGGHPPPGRVVWCGSPLGLALTRVVLLELPAPCPNASVWASVRASVRDSVYGQHDAAWLGFCDYFRRIGLIAQTARLEGLWELAKAAGWALPHQQICWVSERHDVVSLDDRARLHNAAGPAVHYPDGFAIYAWHGVRVSRQVIESPATLTPKQITSEPNAEVRRVMLERFGPSNYFAAIGAKRVQADDYGDLYRAEFRHDEPLVMVKVTNSTPESDGSFKDYWLRVPPQMESARQAVAWSFDIASPERYEPAAET